MRSPKVVLGAVVVALATAGYVGYRMGTSSRAGVVPAGAPNGLEPVSDADDERARRQVFQQVAATLARSAEDRTSGAGGTSGTPVKAPDEALHETAEPKPMTAVDERNNAVARLRASGPDSKGLLKRAQALGNVWAALATKRETRAEVGPWECHAAGCLSTIVQRSESEVEDLTNDLSREEEFRTWEWPKMRSGPISRPDGRTEVTWILYSGDEAAAIQ